MAKKITIDVKKLEALGVERLAKILMDISLTNAAAKRQVSIEFASVAGPEHLAGAVRKRLAALARSRAFVDWQGIRKLAHDLDQQRQVIVGALADAAPDEAFELLWRFMELAKPTFDRCDDSNGHVSSVFQTACQAFGSLVIKAHADPIVLADRVFEAKLANDYGQYDDLITILASALGEQGLNHLKDRFVGLLNKGVERPRKRCRDVIGVSADGPIYAFEADERDQVRTARSALQDIADAQGDVDGFMAQYDAKTRRVPKIAAEIAIRLVKANRANEALVVLDEAERRHPDDADDWYWGDFEWENARIAAFDSLKRTDDAQRLRWKCFEATLSETHLRDYLKNLPDFEDLEAEGKAFEYAQKFRRHTRALAFFINWPSLDQGSRFVLKHASDLDGNRYDVLTPAAEAFAGKYPLAASLTLRPMIDFTLNNARSSRYRHAARHLAECEGLATRISDFGIFESHEEYLARLRKQHDRKASFWSIVR